MQTGQNSIAPENSLPQLGQVRLVSVLIVLDALQLQPQPTATPPSHRVVRNRPAWPLANCCPAAQAIACSFIVARQIRFRNKIATVWCPAASRVDNDLRRWGGSKLAAVNRVVNQT